MNHQELLLRIASMIDDLGWDYDRMSSSGQTVYDKLALTINSQSFEDILAELEKK